MIKWNEQKKLGAALGMHPTSINAILNRRTRCPAGRAQDMSAAYLNLFGVYVPPGEFVLNMESVYPIFKETADGDRTDAAV
ncbi:MAG: hypothetical protein GY809_22675 [Planctomycetes bacterium]|nr:hypothetical protein [Planctomycetota bacterium]